MDKRDIGTMEPDEVTLIITSPEGEVRTESAVRIPLRDEYTIEEVEE